MNRDQQEGKKVISFTVILILDLPVFNLGLYQS